MGKRDSDLGPTPPGVATPVITSEASGDSPNGLGDVLTGSEGGDKGANIVPEGDGLAPALDPIADVHAISHEGFDAGIHAVDAAGNPIKKADGTFAKKRGRKADLKNAGSALPNPNAPAMTNAPSIRSDVLTSEQASKQLVNMFLNGAVMVFGPEWEPENISEAKGLVYSLKDYFDIRGVPKFPPELGLVIAFGAYALPRLKKEKTQSKLKGWKDSIVLFFANFPR